MSLRLSVSVSRRPPGRAAFTLVEIVVVLGIVVLLLTLIIPAIWSVKESAHTTACLSNLRQLGAGLNLYLGDHDLTIPTLQSGRSSLSQNVPVIDNTIDSYVKSRTVFACPSDHKYAKTTGTSYFWNSALNGQKLSELNFLNLTPEQSRIPLISDKEGFHPFQENKVNILYADGHAAKDVRFTTDR